MPVTPCLRKEGGPGQRGFAKLIEVCGIRDPSLVTLTSLRSGQQHARGKARSVGGIRGTLRRPCSTSVGWERFFVLRMMSKTIVKTTENTCMALQRRLAWHLRVRWFKICSQTQRRRACHDREHSLHKRLANDNDSARQRQRQDDSGKTSVAIVAQASESE